MAQKEEAQMEEDHLCVLVHGLWGNPTHLEYLSSALHNRYPHVRHLVCKRNSGNFTYDGIETGGERVTKEIESALEEYSRKGITIKRLSIVGYSLGGLVSRYAVGLLYTQGWFEKLQPVNFTTFATPHLGVRTPLLGWHNHLWNVLGARVLSASGRQLFLIDNFRNTGRPLLSVLADRDSIFHKGLSRFSSKALYANIVNDPSTPFYTSGISRIDPFARLSAISVNYVSGYEPVIVDSINPISPVDTKIELPLSHRITITTQGIVKKLPRVLLYVLFVPIVIVGFLLNAIFQTITSWRRIHLHLNKEGEREGYHYYRTLPLMLVEEMQEAVEGVIEDIHQMQEPEHLPSGIEESVYFGQLKLRSTRSAPALGTIKDSIGTHKSVSQSQVSEKKLASLRSSTTEENTGTSADNSGPASDSEYERVPSVHHSQFSDTDGEDGYDDECEWMENQPLLSAYDESPGEPMHKSNDGSGQDSPEGSKQMEFPTLALAQSQFKIIQDLDLLDFEKFPVWIHKDPHAHGAIIVRKPWKKSWSEGKIVVKHWVEEVFLP